MRVPSERHTLIGSGTRRGSGVARAAARMVAWQRHRSAPERRARVPGRARCDGGCDDMGTHATSRGQHSEEAT